MGGPLEANTQRIRLSGGGALALHKMTCSPAGFFNKQKQENMKSKDELIEQMLKEKGDLNNIIDLDAYAAGLIAMYEKLYPEIEKATELLKLANDCVHKWGHPRTQKLITTFLEGSGNKTK